METIKLAQGSGGLQSAQLVQKIILKYFGNPLLNKLEDAALLANIPPQIAFTTDSFVAQPIFFPGGNIGDLAVCGTINDLAVRGAVPKYLSVSFILEDGLPMKDFEAILSAMRRRAKEAAVTIACGDTKVVPRGACDKIFINTSGIGFMLKNANLAAKNIKPGDALLISGALGEHSVTLMNARHKLGIKSALKTDSAPLHKMTAALIKNLGKDIKFMRDITRGGLSSVLNEIAGKNAGFEVEETKIPVTKPVKAASALLGLDVLDMANEGKLLAVVSADKAEKALQIMRAAPYGKNAAIIGRAQKTPRVDIITPIGTKRILRAPQGEILPRIC